MYHVKERWFSRFLSITSPLACLVSSNMIRILVSKIAENELMTLRHSIIPWISFLFDQTTALCSKRTTSTWRHKKTSCYLAKSLKKLRAQPSIIERIFTEKYRYSFYCIIKLICVEYITQQIELTFFPLMMWYHTDVPPKSIWKSV